MLYDVGRDARAKALEEAEAKVLALRHESAVSMWTGNARKFYLVRWKQWLADLQADRREVLNGAMQRLDRRSLSSAHLGWRHRTELAVAAKELGRRVMMRAQRQVQWAAWSRWAEHVRQVLGGKRILKRLFKGALFTCFEIWDDCRRARNSKKMVAAARIQARRRGQLGRRGTEQQRAAAAKIQAMHRGNRGRRCAAGIAGRAKAHALGPAPPSAVDQLLESISDDTHRHLSSGPSKRRLSTAATVRMAALLAPFAPVTESELEIMGIQSRTTRQELLRLCGGVTKRSHADAKRAAARREASARAVALKSRVRVDVHVLAARHLPVRDTHWPIIQ